MHIEHAIAIEHTATKSMLLSSVIIVKVIVVEVIVVEVDAVKDIAIKGDNADSIDSKRA